jgi:hypothetical protein
MTRVLSLLFAFGLCCSAQENVPVSHPEPRVVSDLEKHLQGYLEMWQTRLNLGKWKVVVLVVLATELKPKTLGNVRWDVSKMVATIRVLRPEDYDPRTKDVLGDMEETVVHELVHLCRVFLPSDICNKEEDRRLEEERVVVMLTHYLLVSSDRGTK